MHWNGHDVSNHFAADKNDLVTTDLNPRFTFESFVVGPANRLASAAARRAAEAPGTSYNPLFLYSMSGLGKSHILVAIAHFATRVHPEKGVRYLAVESFLGELSAALRSGKGHELRERYARLDILLLDDIQFLTGQTEAQEMLLVLLDELSVRGSQVVLASDRPPSEIDGLDARLVSRFSGGLIVDIAPPEYETRVAILRRRAEGRGQRLSPGVAEVISRSEMKNVRELAGALNKILAVQELEGKEVTKSEVRGVLGIRNGGAEAVASTDIEARMDEFGAFISELSSTVASKVEYEEEPWRRQLRTTAETFEADGYSASRLRRLLEYEAPPEDIQAACDTYRVCVQRLRAISRELDRVGNPWPEAAVGLLRDPDRVEEAESLLASSIERVRPFPRLGEGPQLSDIEAYCEPLLLNAARQVVEEDRPEFNPLYLWSADPARAIGVMGALGRSYLAADSMCAVAITSAKEFAEDFIRALADGVAGAWRERWWTVDLLLVYDIQALSDTERAQDEFFHLFEAANRRGAKVIITADRPPSGIASIDERLGSRFEGGLVVQVTSTQLPLALAQLNLEPAPPEFIQDENLWSSLERPKVKDGIIPPLDELQLGERGGLFPDAVGTDAYNDALSLELERLDLGPVVEVVPKPDRAGAWYPSKERVVLDWPFIEDRIVEDVEKSE